MNTKKSVVFFFLINISIFAFSQVGGLSTYEFLNLPVSARVSALGGSLISTKDNDLNTTLSNPALLSDSMSNTVALSYVSYLADVNYGYAVYAKKFKKIGTFSGGIHYLDYGKFIRADEVGNTDGNFGANEMSFNVSYARSVYDTNLTVGATLKTIYSHLDTYTSWGSAVDLGAIYTIPSRGVAFAAVIKNAGFQWKPYTQGNREKLPFETQLGLSKKLKHVPFRLSLVYRYLDRWDLTYQDPANPVLTVDPITGDAIKQNKGKIFGDKLMRHFVIGGEFLVTKSFSLRVGYDYQRRKELEIEAKRGMTGFSFGFGFRIYKFQISYARAAYNLAGASNNFTISFDINSFYSKK
jgi:hypothetical protein